jgi:hypothetical protein
MTILQRITTEYIDLEDRVRLTGEAATGATVSLWLTQRLLGRLVGAILPWIAEGDDGYQAVKNGFSQAAARAGLQRQPPVPAQSSPCLVTKVDLRHNAEALTLTFCGAEGLAAELTLQRQDMRQWLNILFDIWRAADWPPSVWPDWMNSQDAKPPPAPLLQLH